MCCANSSSRIKCGRRDLDDLGELVSLVFGDVWFEEAQRADDTPPLSGYLRT